jgi:thiopeptide-type bacteriocin biosynthesis protein
MPRYVVKDGTRGEELIDLADDRSRARVAAEILKQGCVSLSEHFPSPERSPVEGDGGAYLGEVLLPFRVAVGQTPPVRSTVASPAFMEEASVGDCVFPPGSEWLYLRVCASPKILDGVVLRAVAAEVRALRLLGHLDSWFFVRYPEPEWHLRVRLRGDAEFLMGVALPRLLSVLGGLHEDAQVGAFSVDTYVREVRRYGGTAFIGAAEEILHADSEYVTDVLFEGDRGLIGPRWIYAALGVDRILHDFGMGLSERQKLALRMSQQLAVEVGSERLSGREASRRWRRMWEQGRPLFNGGDGRVLDLLAERSTRVAAPVSVYRTGDVGDRLTMPLDAIVGSLAHMHVNRLLEERHVVGEADAWTFLQRMYHSTVSRQ